ncbi:MAG TPA: hypothetical protein VKU35_04315 [Candidatus Limnocylindria bacterium]|nr:hypothetical protein [Candidatus Limnocylindria bacterium]
MPALPVLLVGCALLGVAMSAAALGWLRAIGAHLRTGRRLAGARELTVGDVLDLEGPLPRAVRVAGRIRCPDPLVAADGEQLVAYHRDVEVRLPGGRWRTVERLRETRSFELWDHAGSLAVDPARAAEPLISIPLVWEGRPDELEEPHASAAARLAAEGHAPTAARAVTRTISVVDRLLVLAEVSTSLDGNVRLVPPRGGYLICSIELDAAMRVLGGPRRRQLAAAIGLLAIGLALAGASLVAVAIVRLAGA